MATKTELIIDKKQYRLLECSFDYHQSVDHSGKPSARVRAGSILVVVDFDGEEELINWAGNDHTTRSGKIIFYKSDGMGIKFNLEFSEAYCSDMYVYQSNLVGGGVLSELKINARKMTVTGHTHTNNWPTVNNN
ncbi:type VI secretion system tube protein TssD [Aquimarina longa]|uniref:type VI secretion system tube protein TssD n=1 Tax=Aquimarina longa TaxID=1080221 RepID=UPI000780B388|nr:type VI secretion system tube protein TssD [Aquimarina longa]